MSTPVDELPELSPDASPRSRTRNLGLALIVIAAAQLMVVLDASIVNIALPRVQTDLGFSKSGLQWVVTAYALALGSLLLLGGRLGDLFGRRRMFTVGVTVFAAASLLGGLAPNPTVLLLARVLQGAAAALAAPAALALINTTFPVGKDRNRAMAVYAAMSGAGAAIGLILGGALTQLEWRWTFFINVPIGAVVALLAPRVLVESEGSDARLDITGAVLGTAGLFGIVYGLSHAAQQSASWGDALTLIPLIGGVLLLAGFVVAERRAAHPLLPLRILTNRTRGTSLAAMLIAAAGLFAMFYFVGLYVQQVLGYQPVVAGLAFLPFSVGLVISAGIASQLVSRVPPRFLAGTGAIMAGVGMWGFTHLTVHSSYVGGLLPWITVLSLGMGLLFIPLTMAATHGVQEADSGAAAAALNAAQQIGGAVGLAALSTVFSHAYTRKANDMLSAAATQAQAAGTPVPTDPAARQQAIGAFLTQHGAELQTYASTQGIWVAVGMFAVAAAAILAFLTVKHSELQAGEGAPVAL